MRASDVAAHGHAVSSGRLRLMLRVAAEPSGGADARKKRIGGEIAGEGTVCREIAPVVAIVVEEKARGIAVAVTLVSLTIDDLGLHRRARHRDREGRQQDCSSHPHPLTSPIPYQPTNGGLAVPQSPFHPVSLPR